MVNCKTKQYNCWKKGSDWLYQMDFVFDIFLSVLTFGLWFLVLLNKRKDTDDNAVFDNEHLINKAMNDIKNKVDIFNSKLALANIQEKMFRLKTIYKPFIVYIYEYEFHKTVVIVDKNKGYILIDCKLFF